jgi:ribosomal-protein-alanine N-acetyltransferase
MGKDKLNILISDFNAKSADLAPILAIERNAFSSPWTEEMFIDALKNSTTRFKVAASFGKIIGYIIYWVLAGETSLLDIAVVKEYRRKGIAKQMLEFMEADSVKNNSREIFLEVRPSNKEALSLYLNFGYKQIDVRKKYYTTEDALILRKQLPGEV